MRFTLGILATPKANGFVRRGQRWALLVATVLLVHCNSVAACPTCKDGMSNSSNLINGYGWSIIFMMSMPFLILAGVGSYFYYEICRARKIQQLTLDSNSPSTD